MTHRRLTWLAAALLAALTLPLPGLAWLLAFGGNRARVPLQALVLQRAGIGQLDGDIELAGQGEISRLLLERIGLHLLEILRLNLTGDQRVPMHCAVADFDVARGASALAPGLLNPLLALIPLFQAGPGVGSDCDGLLRAARWPAGSW
jgi:hypothetical protein